MSWLFSRALVAESLAGICSAGELSAQSSETPTLLAYLWRDKTTDAWRRFPSGMTCEHLTADRGKELLTWYLEGFRAKTSVRQAKAPESMASVRDCGARWRELLAKFSRDSRSSKIVQCWLFAGSIEFCATLPKWGMNRGGDVFPLPTPFSLLAIRQRITAANEFGLRQEMEKRGTPTATMSRRSKKFRTKSPTPAEAVERLPTPRSQEPGRTSKGYGRGLAELIEGNEQIEKVPTARCQMTRPIATRNTASGHKGNLEEVLAVRDASLVGGKLNPQWVEWLMGWPVGWTDLRQLEMDKFQQWQQLHGQS